MLSRREIFQLGAAAGATAIVSGVRAQMAHSAPSAPNAEALAERLVTATGGRDNWARVKGLGITARHYETALAQPYDNHLYVAMEQPRMRFEARGEGFAQVRVVSGNKGLFSTRGGPPRPMTAAAVKGDLDWWETHFYRNIRRLAVRDPAIRLRRHADGRLELYRPDGKRLLWYRLNQQGEPVAFGSFDNEEGNVFGPLHAVPGGLRLPTFAVSHDGTFRAVDLQPTVYPGIPPVDYDKP
jgi:hypothetical protein